VYSRYYGVKIQEHKVWDDVTLSKIQRLVFFSVYFLSSGLQNHSAVCVYPNWIFEITVLLHVHHFNFWDHIILYVLSLQLYRSQCCLCAPSFQLLRPQCCLYVPHFKLWGKIAVCVYTISTFEITVLSACAPISTFSITNAVFPLQL
jgi:hypothetical protein